MTQPTIPLPTPSLARPRRPGRPPKVDRDNLETREALLRRGLEVLTEQSFSATGLDYFLKEVGIPKGSFYHM
ncbi:TetR/AcrR family transcriptional regulator, partial [Pseudomonas syringae]